MGPRRILFIWTLAVFALDVWAESLPHSFTKSLISYCNAPGVSTNRTARSRREPPKTTEIDIKWDTFLKNLHVRFSKYDIQKYKSKYNVEHIEEWGQVGKTQGLKVNEETINTFLNKIADYKINGYDEIKTLAATPTLLEDLNHVLNLTLGNKPSITCSDSNTLLIKGDYVKFSNFIKSDGSFVSTCNSSVPKKIKIFALNTVFINRNIHGGGRISELTIIAPRWAVVGKKVEINLNGVDGNPPNKPNAEEGEAGKKGLPGGPGGNFLGIGIRFLNSKNLHITAVGGKGGPGQNGGKGRNGQDGNYADLTKTKTRCSPDLCKNKEFIGVSSRGKDDIFYCEVLKLKSKTKYIGTPGMPSLFDYVQMHKCQVKIHGDNGTLGRNGGDGGKGGEGGYPGNLVLYDLKNLSSISKTNMPGEDGLGGEGGAGGISGKKGLDSIISGDNFSWKIDEQIKHDERPPPGDAGLKGVSVIGSKDKELPDIPEPAYLMINSYKSFLRENLADRFKEEQLTRFWTNIDNNELVRDAYDTVGLADDLRSLEEQIHELKMEIDFVPFYQSLKERILSYAENKLGNLQNVSQYKKMLSYLYTAATSRVNSLEDHMKSNLVMNVASYLEYVEKNMDILGELSKKHEEFNVVAAKLININEQKQLYVNRFDSKIEEANSLAEQVNTELSAFEDKIDDGVDDLIQEVSNSQAAAWQERDQAIKLKSDLRTKFMIKLAFEGLRMAGYGLTFLGPVGLASNALILTVSTVAKQLIFKEMKFKETIPEIPRALSNIEGLLEAVKNRKLAGLNEAMETYLKEAEDEKNLNDVTEETSALKGSLRDVTDLEGVEEVQTKFKTTLELKLESLEKEKLTTTENFDRPIEILEKFNKVWDIGENLLPYYRRYVSEQQKVDAMNDVIEGAEDKFRVLKNFEKEMYNIVVPALKNMKMTFERIQSQLRAESRMALNLNELKIQDVLKKMKSNVQQLIGSFGVSDYFESIIERFSDTLTKLTRVYDYIQDYQEQKELAVYIADLTSAAARDVKIQDKDLEDMQKRVEIAIASNLVAQQYQSAIETMKQFVFPFAAIYLHESELPEPLQTENSFENLVSKAAEKVKSLRTKLNEYRQSLTSSDGCTGSGEFNSHYDEATVPFFTWKNEDHKEEISKLLSGQNVILKADILQSPHKQDAIKFNIIKLHFKARDATLQPEIEKELNKFNMYMTHLGDSQYRYNSKIYEIASSTQDIWFSVRHKNGTDEPIHKGGAYEKIKRGDFMLSPFALWKMNLTEATLQPGNVYDKLKEYKDDVDLELEGHGYYVVRGDNCCSNLDIHEYYESLDIEVPKIVRPVDENADDEDDWLESEPSDENF